MIHDIDDQQYNWFCVRLILNASNDNKQPGKIRGWFQKVMGRVA